MSERTVAEYASQVPTSYQLSGSNSSPVERWHSDLLRIAAHHLAPAVVDAEQIIRRYVHFLSDPVDRAELNAWLVDNGYPREEPTLSPFGGDLAEIAAAAAEHEATRCHAPAPSPDPVNHPPHYCSHPAGIECIQVVEHMSFNVGNAIKYLWRADEKGRPIEDLRKAAWYINREIERRERLKK